MLLRKLWRNNNGNEINTFYCTFGYGEVFIGK